MADFEGGAVNKAMRRGQAEWWFGGGNLLAVALWLALPADAADTTAADRAAARGPFEPLPRASVDRMLADPGLLIVATDPRLPPPAAPPSDKGAKASAGPEPCFRVATIETSGIILVDRESVRTAIAPFLQSCQGDTSVRGLLLSINALYASHGYITTQAYLPKQAIKASAKVVIEIKAGRIAEVTYREAPAWDQGTYWERLGGNGRALFSAATVDHVLSALETLAETIDDPLERPLLPWPEARTAGTVVAVPGEVLNIERIQQGLDQINRAPSSKAKSKLDPGTEPATSKVTIVNPQDDAFRVTAGIDTYGSVSTGIVRYRSELARDNLIGVNDTWRASLTSSRLTNEATATFAVPYLWGSWSLDTKYSEALVPLGSVAELFTQTTTIGSTIGTTVQRTPSGRLDVSAGLRTYHNTRYINDVQLTPQVLTAAELGFSRSFILGSNGMFSLGARAGLGTRWFGASDDGPDPFPTQPRAQFAKIDGTASLQYGVVDGVTLTSALTWQYANVPLYSPDQFTVGGLTSVRGFNASPVLGDRGAHLRTEIGLRPPVETLFSSLGWTSNWLASRAKAIEGYAFADGGYVYDVANARETMLAGAGVGVRIRDHRLTLDVSVARGLFKDDPSGELATEVYLTAGWKVF